MSAESTSKSPKRAPLIHRVPFFYWHPMWWGQMDTIKGQGSNLSFEPKSRRSSGCSGHQVKCLKGDYYFQMSIQISELLSKLCFCKRRSRGVKDVRGPRKKKRWCLWFYTQNKRQICGSWRGCGILKRQYVSRLASSFRWCLHLTNSISSETALTMPHYLFASSFPGTSKLMNIEGSLSPVPLSHFPGNQEI